MVNGRSSVSGSSLSMNGTGMSDVSLNVVPFTSQRTWLLPLVRSGITEPQSRSGRNRTRTRGDPARGRISRTNMTGWYSRSNFWNRGQKSVICTMFPAESSSSVTRTAVLRR